MQPPSEIPDGFMYKLLIYRQIQVSIMAVIEMVAALMYYGYCAAFGNPEKCFPVPPLPKGEDLWAMIVRMTPTVAAIEFFASWALLWLAVHGPRRLLFVLYVLVNTFCTVYYPLWHLSCSSRVFQFIDLLLAVLSVIFRQLCLTATIRLYCLQTSRIQSLFEHGRAENQKKIITLADVNDLYRTIKSASFTFKKTFDFTPMKLKVTTLPGNTYTTVEIMCDDDIKFGEKDYKIPLIEDEKNDVFELPPKLDTVDPEAPLMSEVDSVSDDSENEGDK